MLRRFLKSLLSIFVFLAFLGVGYLGVQAITKNPCTVPKTWSIGAIDSRFGISKDTVKLYGTQAQNLWNAASTSTPLLQYKENDSNIIITFVYDERQRTTIQNEKLKQSIETEKDTLDDLKRTIESLRAEYTSLETIIDTKTKDYTSRLAEHNSEVRYWNSQGGASPDEYQRLERERASLETERTALNSTISRFNQLGERIKNYGRDHNEVVDTINEKIQTLNETALRDFEEGTYDPGTRTITIYEYADAMSLKRVLAHELGHALGLRHVEDKDAIMYPVNQSKNLELAQGDLNELSQVCREKSKDDLLGMLQLTRDGIVHLVVSSWRDIAVPAK